MALRSPDGKASAAQAAIRWVKPSEQSIAELSWTSLPLAFSQTINQIHGSATQTCLQPDYLLLNKCISVNQEACLNYLIEELLIRTLILNVQMFQ